ncbi:MAG: hypothetical protein RIR18_1233 [Pseudomonadota bacterium]|jgi:hypothetical protein
MRKKSLPMILLATCLGFIASVANAAPDWTKVETTQVFVFYPGTTPWQWVTTKGKHGGSRGLVRGETCIGCHMEGGDLNLDMARISSEFEPAGAPKTKIYPVKLQTAYDAENLYIRLTFTPPSGGFDKGDQDNELKATVLLADPAVPLGNQVGCWASCHSDARTMPGADSQKLKYVKEGSYALMQWTDKGNISDGSVSDARRMTGGNAGVKAESSKNGSEYTVTFTRKNPGEGKAIPMGIAIHADHASGRFHHVSLGYVLGIGAEGDIKATKQ